jgi:predicted SprT family Zn-dependent metalloprotease
MLGSLWTYKSYKINLGELGYRFEWDLRSKRRFGYFNRSEKVIGISYNIAQLNLGTPNVITNVILHEIAHALEWELFKCQGHSKRWSEILLCIGGDGKKYYSLEDVKTPTPKYELVCPCCGKSYPRRRYPKRIGSCSVCDSKYNPEYKLKFKQNY